MARNTALEVVEKLRRGEKPVVYKIAQKHGYSLNSALTSVPQNTLTYKAIVDPVIKEYERARTKAMKALADKDMSEERAIDLSTIAKNLTHDIQLLSGKSTSTDTTTEDKQVIINILQLVQRDNTAQ